MKLKITALLLGGFLALGALAQPQPLPTSTSQAPVTEPVPPDKEKLGYAIGMNIGTSLKRQELEINPDSFLQGLRDALSGQPSKLSEKEVRELLSTDVRNYMNARRQYQIKKLELMGAQAKKDGLEFLAKNVNAEGVKTLPDGLQYQVIKEGAGETPTTEDAVHVSYKGTLTDGTEFDANTNANMRVGQVIKGWQEALSKMKVGSHWKVFIPADLAYSTNAQPPKIAPNSVLIFDMELLGVQHAPPRPPAGMLGGPHPTAMTSSGSTNGSVVSGQIIRVPSKAELDKGAKIEVIDPNSTNAASAK